MLVLVLVIVLVIEPVEPSARDESDYEDEHENRRLSTLELTAAAFHRTHDSMRLGGLVPFQLFVTKYDEALSETPTRRFTCRASVQQVGTALAWVGMCGSALLLAGCISTGQMAGRLAKPDEPAVPVTLEYQTSRFGQGGTMWSTLPNGEFFDGKYLQITAAATADTIGPVAVGWGWGWAPVDPWFAGVNATTFVQQYSGRVVATLFGDQGHVMRCRLNLSNPAGGITGGGIGECEVSNGERIDVQF